MIYFGLRYTADVQGQAWKTVTCEVCHRDYVYLMHRVGTGTDRSPYMLNNRGAERRSQEIAIKSLKRKLDSECDPIPCPDCGWYQKPMVKLLRRRRWGKLNVAGWIVLVASLVIAGLFSIADGHPGGQYSRMSRPVLTSPIVWVPISIGVAMIALSWIGRSLQDPNKNHPGRSDFQNRGEVEPCVWTESERARLQATETLASALGISQGSQAVEGGRVQCTQCQQIFVTTAIERCPLCSADWIQSPPRVAA